MCHRKTYASGDWRESAGGAQPGRCAPMRGTWARGWKEVGRSRNKTCGASRRLQKFLARGKRNAPGAEVDSPQHSGVNNGGKRSLPQSGISRISWPGAHRRRSTALECCDCACARVSHDPSICVRRKKSFRARRRSACTPLPIVAGRSSNRAPEFFAETARRSVILGYQPKSRTHNRSGNELRERSRQL